MKAIFQPTQKVVNFSFLPDPPVLLQLARRQDPLRQLGRREAPH